MAVADLEIRNTVLARLKINHDNPGASWGPWIETSGDLLVSYDPSDGTPIAKVRMANEEDYDEVVFEARKTFERWRMFPAPKRGAIVREIGEELRLHKNELGALVSIEMGKILQEGLGEVQEMIDIAEFAVGLSRQLYGLSMHSERPLHRMYEQWHPLGVVGVI
ncbi:MAG: aldehyde dehydrogenase family protein, partial [Bryobacteraceae bacterium]|nr:aldehyde dehydrogenase family protein [Bryobacteraceae bacterium]